MAVVTIIENPLGRIESYQRNFELVYRAISIDEVRGQHIVVERIKNLSEARKLLWENSRLNKETEENHSLHWYVWGDEPKDRVSTWIDFHNGTWMSLGYMHSIVEKSEDFTNKKYPIGN